VSTDFELANAQVALLACLKRCSLQQFTPFEPDVVSSPIEGKDLSGDHWVASVLLNISKAQVLMRVHFSSATGRALVANRLQEEPNSLTPASAHDFLKEYCNVVMGKLKGIIASELGREEMQKVFLPKVEPSYDQFGVIRHSGGQPIQDDWWRLKWPAGELVVYARATSTAGFTPATLESLSKETILSVSDSGDIDFF
jgi:hypothetical protein